MFIDKEELLERIQEKYGSLSSDRGCYVNGSWMSIEEIVNLINDCAY